MIEHLTQPAAIYSGLGPSRRELVDISILHYHEAWIKYGLDKGAPPTIFNAIGPDPIPSIGDSGVLISGHELFERARSEHANELMCLRFSITDDDALRWMIKICHHHTNFNDFTRVALALELEGPRLRFLARQNMSAGGKGLANLPYPQINLRQQIGAMADVKERNVGKVILICECAHQDVIQALRDDEISIDRAYQWMQLSSENQLKALCELREQSHVNASRIKNEERKFRQEVESAQKKYHDPLTTEQVARALLQRPEHNAKVLVIESKEPYLAVSTALLKHLQIQASFFTGSKK